MFGPTVGGLSPSPLTASPGGTVTLSSASSVVAGIAGCSNSDATISCVRPPSTFSRSAAGCPAPTAPDTVDCHVSVCTLGVLLGLVAAKTPRGANAGGGRLTGSSGAAIVVDAASEPHPNVGRSWVWGVQQSIHCSTTRPSPADSSVGGLVSPPSGYMALHLSHRKLPTKWIKSHFGADCGGCDIGLREKPLWPTCHQRPCVQPGQQ